MTGKRETHTPEPWEFRPPDDRLNLPSHICAITKEHGHRVTKFIVHHGVIEANARRIVACVNACAGIETETLEPGRTGWLCEHLAHDAQNIIKLQARADAAEALLEEARTELKQAIVELEEAAKLLQGSALHGSASLMTIAAERKRAFLAKTEKPK